MLKRSKVLVIVTLSLMLTSGISLAADYITDAPVGSSSATTTHFDTYDDDYSSACGGTYSVEYKVSRGAVSSSSVYFNWQSIRVYNLTGYAFGGMAYLDNLASTPIAHYGLFNTPLTAGVTWKVIWNRSLTLGSSNLAISRQHHYSGQANTNAPLCGHTEQVIFEVQSSTPAGTNVMMKQSESNDIYFASLDEAETTFGKKLMRPKSLPGAASKPTISFAPDAGRLQTVYLLENGILDITQSDRRITITAEAKENDSGMRVLQGTNVSDETVTMIELKAKGHWVYVFTTLPLEEAIAIAESLAE